MEIFDTQLMDFLARYVIDHGATLLREAGESAKELASKIFAKAMGPLLADPAEAKNAERFEQDPEGYRTPVADALKERLAADPDLAAELRTLLERLEKVAASAGVTIVNTGSGTVATHGGVGAGQGGMAVGGNVGGIHVGKSRGS